VLINFIVRVGALTAYNTASCAALTAFAWASPHFHLRCATVKTSHTPGTLHGIVPAYIFAKGKAKEGCAGPAAAGSRKAGSPFSASSARDEDRLSFAKFAAVKGAFQFPVGIITRNAVVCRSRPWNSPPGETEMWCIRHNVAVPVGKVA